MPSRTYYDPLHKSIKLDSTIPEEGMVLELIDSAPFQRLRKIRQLGPASLTFHGAESSRFTHSLGVFHIARRAFNKLVDLDPKLKNFRALLYGAALLHDIGHGPLSHTSEEMFHIKHEHWTAKLIKEHRDIRNILDSFSRGLAYKIADIVEGKGISLKAISTLISSQLDCDRLDYLMRDSYSTGAQYGQLDLERILSALTLSPDGDLAIHPKGLLAVEHYLIVRNLMYRGIYNHRLNEVCNWLLNKIISTAKNYGPKLLWCDKVMHNWLWNQQELSIEDFLQNDDIRTGYHLLRWSEDAKGNLGTLCRNFLNRKLLKAVNVEYLKNESQLEALSIAINLSEKIGKDASICCGLRHNKVYGYHQYKSGLRLWDGDQLKAIEQESPLVEKLISPSQASWLIHPKEIQEDLKHELIRLRKDN
ncbi:MULTISPECIES: HD domain-containing protein [Prochlorococcus]|uniref:HD domain-containing protein n=1 Tax=Prochlorococcus TaxID=1218 RepID=UPI000533B57B|nr:MULTISPECIES: HD domain-containing protein [Prochlorococcus]KGG13030.1 putative dNTP triphosphohydrolase [Prochlorococcus sp. MIT 0601]